MVQSSGNEAQWARGPLSGDPSDGGTPPFFVPVLLPFLRLLSSPPTPPHPLTFLVEHPPAGYPAGRVPGELHARDWEAGGDDGGGEVHRRRQLQHGDVAPEGMQLLEVWVRDNPAHGYLPGLRAVLVELGAP